GARQCRRRPATGGGPGPVGAVVQLPQTGAAGRAAALDSPDRPLVHDPSEAGQRRHDPGGRRRRHRPRPALRGVSPVHPDPLRERPGGDPPVHRREGEPPPSTAVERDLEPRRQEGRSPAGGDAARPPALLRQPADLEGRVGEGRPKHAPPQDGDRDVEHLRPPVARGQRPRSPSRRRRAESDRRRRDDGSHRGHFADIWLRRRLTAAYLCRSEAINGGEPACTPDTGNGLLLPSSNTRKVALTCANDKRRKTTEDNELLLRAAWVLPGLWAESCMFHTVWRTHVRQTSPEQRL